MEPIYVIGHRNPDTDSIVSAIAYASLRNALGDREYVAARLGGVSDETQRVLDRFGFEAPPRLSDMRTQVRDMDYDTPPAIGWQVTVSHAWDVMRGDEHIMTLPVTDDGGGLYGMLTRGDIASYDMGSIELPMVKDVPLFNLLGVLEGRVIGDGADDIDEISGEVVISLGGGNAAYTGAIVLCAATPEAVEASARAGARLVIPCGASVGEIRRPEGGAIVIATPFDAYRASRMIYQAIPVSRICRRDNIVKFHLDDYLDDVRETVLQSRYRSYPILDAEGRVAGALSRYHLLRPRRKRVVLVDHNERAQSVRGLDQVEIVEIIDHHRLADVETAGPVRFRNEPVGATATIIASMYRENGLMPSPKLAGLIASAILSDTVMFKSPTCTERDRAMAERMARLAGVGIEELGLSIFTSALNKKPAADMLMSDFKEFHIAGHSLGIGQITCIDSDNVLTRKAEFLSAMDSLSKEKGYDSTMLMITDVLKEGTALIFRGDKKTIDQAFSVEAGEDSVYLPKIVSRKKQIVPLLSVMWG